MTRKTLAVLAIGLVLQACGTPRSAGPGSHAPAATASGGGAPPAARVSPLATERQWLQAWFKDTPAGPSIVVCAAALFLLSFLLPRRKG